MSGILKLGGVTLGTENNGTIDLEFHSTSHDFTLKAVDAQIVDSIAGEGAGVSNATSGQLAIYNGATKLWGINESGWVQNPNVPAFDIIRTTDISAPFTFSPVTEYNTNNFNITSSADLSTGKFTAPISGLYHFYMWVTFTGGDGSDDSMGIGIVKNATSFPSAIWRINPRFITRSGIEHTYTFTQSYEMSAGDYTCIATADMDNSTTIQEVRFGGYLIG